VQSDDGLEAHFRLLVWSKLDFDLVLGVDVIHGGGGYPEKPHFLTFFSIFFFFQADFLDKSEIPVFE
jgi:hypothetical protein